MSSRRILLGVAAILGAMLTSATPSNAVVAFAPEGGAVIITAPEAVFFKRIVCKKITVSGGKIRRVAGLSKVEQNVTYEECKNSLANVRNFSIKKESLNVQPVQAAGVPNTISFAEPTGTTIEVEEPNLCTITIPFSNGENLVIPKISYTDEPPETIKAKVELAGGTSRGIKFTAVGAGCGPIKEEQEGGKEGAYEITETMAGVKKVNVAAKCGEEEEKAGPSLPPFGRPIEADSLLEAAGAPAEGSSAI